MDLYIHFGTHKTGSTYIQNVLAHNRDTLSEAKVLYPNTLDARTGHHELAFALQENNIDSARSILDSYMIQAKTHKAMVLSSEEFEFVKHHGIFKDLLSDFDNVVSIFYLRRQDKYLESEYNQHVKMYSTRYCNDIFKFYMEFDFNQRFFYYNLIRRFEDGLNSSIIVNSYDKSLMSNDLLDTFLNSINLTDLKESLYIGAIDRNESLSSRALLKLANFNSNKNVSKAEHMNAMNDFMRLYPSDQYKHEKILSKDICVALVNKYKHQNFLVSERYNDGVSIFDYDFKDNPTVSFYDKKLIN